MSFLSTRLWRTPHHFWWITAPPGRSPTPHSFPKSPFSKPISTGRRKFTLVLLVVAIAADLVLAILIGLDVVKGDWPLPLAFAVIPVIGIAYLAAPGAKTT